VVPKRQRRRRKNRRLNDNATEKTDWKKCEVCKYEWAGKPGRKTLRKKKSDLGEKCGKVIAEPKELIRMVKTRKSELNGI